MTIPSTAIAGAETVNDRTSDGARGGAGAGGRRTEHGPPRGPTRREWIFAVPSTAALAAAGPAFAMGDGAAVATGNAVHAEFPSHDPEAVREVVGASHVRIDRVRELVEASPALAKVAWDWGFGDWESALGAASHMGRRDIAELLMAHGARPDLFTFAMLGHLDVVRACVEALPGIQRTPGPHGITLLQHARNAHRRRENTDDHRANAARVVRYLESVGDADHGATSLAVSDEQKRLYVGRYSFGAGADDAFEVLTNRRGMLAIRRGDRSARTLHRVEEHGFAPAGAPAVRIRFEVIDGRSAALTVHDPTSIVSAGRDG